MHMSKQLDDQTTRLLYAASRGDTATISLICESSFDPNHGDYDHRTALMVASMKGNTEVCRLLLNFKVRIPLYDLL
jgi:Ankyrin repeat.